MVFVAANLERDNGVLTPEFENTLRRMSLPVKDEDALQVSHVCGNSSCIYMGAEAFQDHLRAESRR